MKDVWYLAGPMTGIDKSNLPAFINAVHALRKNDFDVISPVEFASPKAVITVLNGTEESFDDLEGLTWGQALGRDVTVIADRVTGIVFLDGWEQSKGARLEAFVGVLRGHQFANYVGNGSFARMTANMVLTKLTRQTLGDIRNV